MPVPMSLVRFSSTGYGQSDCPQDDKSCWIYIYNGRREGWIAVEHPTTPGVCGAPDGGVRFAVNTTADCVELPGGGDGDWPS
jgi:hypothetical protein